MTNWFTVTNESQPAISLMWLELVMDLFITSSAILGTQRVAIANCKRGRYHSCDCCKGVDCTAPSTVQSRSGPVRSPHVLTSEGLSERPEAWTRWRCQVCSEGVDQTMHARVLWKRIYKLAKPMAKVCCAQWWLCRKIAKLGLQNFAHSSIRCCIIWHENLMNFWWVVFKQLWND